MTEAKVQPKAAKKPGVIDLSEDVPPPETPVLVRTISTGIYMGTKFIDLPQGYVDAVSMEICNPSHSFTEHDVEGIKARIESGPPGLNP
jgi:hypothetical protein